MWPTELTICMKARFILPGRRISFSDLFFFQAEDGIRDLTVTGVQTCALPILKYLNLVFLECLSSEILQVKNNRFWCKTGHRSRLLSRNCKIWAAAKTTNSKNIDRKSVV